MTRSFSTVHGRSRTMKPRPARQSGSLYGFVAADTSEAL
jgi:hypothetical protein